MIAGVDVGIEALNAVGDEFDRPPQQLGQRIGRHLVGIDMHLDAEGAADILADHADLGFPQAQMQRGDVLHHVRRLRALIDREPRFRGIPVGNDCARLQRHAGVAAEDEIRLDDSIGFGKSLIHRSRFVNPFERQIVAERGMNDGRRRIERRAHIGHGLQFLILHRHMLRGVLCRRAAGRHDGRHRLALPADAIDSDRRLRRGFQALEMREHADPWRDDGGKLLARDDGDHARHLFCGGRTDAQNLRMRMWRAQEHDMRHPRQLHVADVSSTPL